MKKVAPFILLLAGCFSVQAQFKNHNGKEQLLGFLRMKQFIAVSKSIKSTPRFTSIPSGTLISASSYWEGATFTNYSENGRLTSTYSFDIQGQLRDIRTSILLRKTGVLSNWSVQFTPQRNNKAIFAFRIQ